MARVTIREIARRSGVSKGAVSYALNNQPGVSASTRARVLRIAEELNWVPNSAARMLSGARTDTVGLVLAGSPAALGYDSQSMEFVAGVESVLTARSHGLLLQVVPAADGELATYRRWASERRVDAVIVVGVRVADPRIALLEGLDTPAVVVGDPTMAGGLTSVWLDDAAAAREVVAHLAELGHRRIGRVAGPAEQGHVRIREEAFAAAATAAGIGLRTVHTDLSGEDAGRATRALLDDPDRVTAIVCDGDLVAVAALSVLHGAGLAVPTDLSLVAWSDSALCAITRPALTAVGCDVAGYGAAVAQRVLDLLHGGPSGPVQAATPTLRRRDSSGPAPARTG